MFETSYIELDKTALQHNYQFLRNLIGNDVQLSSVVKGNAYGHGLEKFISLSEACGANHFAVFSADEAYTVQQVKRPESGLMIMGMIDPSELAWAIENQIEVFIFDLERLEKALATSRKLQIKVKIHLELETGMNRLGLNPSEIEAAVALLKRYEDAYILQGLCTHYAGAESIANYVRVKKQIVTYNKLAKRLKQLGYVPQKYHTACSAATVSYPQTRMNMVRIGILQYGFFPTQETLIQYLKNKKEQIDPLKRVLSWKSKVMNIKTVEAGEFIGYGTSFLASRSMRIATVPVGYAHGYSRSLSNQGHVLIQGKRLNVIGMVNMNLMLVDLESTEGVQAGDEVVLIGTQGDTYISVASFGELSNQLNYELLTRLPRNIPRKVVE
ncbi:MAG: alanine racemase [Thermonemataceae bacterium]